MRARLLAAVFPLAFAIAVIFYLSVPAIRGAEATPAALKTFLEHEGYGGSPLQRRLGNHLFATTVINGRRTALAIDTGAPFTLLVRFSGLGTLAANSA